MSQIYQPLVDRPAILKVGAIKVMARDGELASAFKGALQLSEDEAIWQFKVAVGEQ